MLFFVARRILAAVPTLVAVLTLVFVIVRIVPGDPALVILGDQATPEAIAALRARLGLERPLWEQYIAFIGAALVGDFGNSLVTGRPIVGEVAAVLPHTIDLTVAAMIFGIAVGVPVGIWAALHRNGVVDVAARVLSLLGLSFPVFVSGIFLLLAFALHWRVFPVIGSANLDDPADRLHKLILPAITLGLVMAAYITRVTRSAMLQSLGEDYIRTARAKGMPGWIVVGKHALRNALIPVVTVAGIACGVLLGGAVVIESVFSLPGVGRLIVGAIQRRDYPVIQGGLLLTATIFVLVNLLVDLLYAALDPRIRHGRR